jgi:hypothetical protein
MEEQVKMTPAQRLILARAEKKRRADELNEKLAKLEELESRIEAPSSVSDMVPKTWKDIVNKMLGTDFIVSVEESSGGNYRLKIVVPERYDRRIGDERQMSKQDVSTGIVRRASDVSDVEKWCDLIRKTIKAKHPAFNV